MTVKELKAKRDQKEAIEILDVREKKEFDYANLGGVHLPLGELATRYCELDPNQKYAVLCHHGMRSAQAVAFLKQAGFQHVENVSGGIDAWSVTVDPTVPRY